MLGVKVMVMEPISEVLSTLVVELIERETDAGRRDRAIKLEEAATQAALPGFDSAPTLSNVSNGIYSSYF